MRYLIPSNILSQIKAADSVAYAVITGQSTYSIIDPGSSPPPPDGQTPIARYRSFEQMQSDITATPPVISSQFSWLLYDPEADSPNFTGTPLSEQQDPFTALRHAAQFAHSKNYRILSAPGRDLANTCTTNKKQPGETLDGWYLRTQIAATAAYADFIDIQAQADTVPTQTYHDFYSQARTQARDPSTGNPYVITFAGISTGYGTASDMVAAIHSVTAGGVWLNVPDGDIAKAATFLKNV